MTRPYFLKPEQAADIYEGWHSGRYASTVVAAKAHGVDCRQALNIVKGIFYKHATEHLWAKYPPVNGPMKIGRGPKYSDETIMKILVLAQHGLTDSQVAKRIGCDTKYARDIRQERYRKDVIERFNSDFALRLKIEAELEEELEKAA